MWYVTRPAAAVVAAAAADAANGNRTILPGLPLCADGASTRGCPYDDQHSRLARIRNTVENRQNAIIELLLDRNFAKGEPMYFTIVLTSAIGLIVLGLIRLTESVLDIRQQRREQGDDPKAYL